MFMGTIFVLYPWKCNTRQIPLGQALQVKFFFIDLDLIGGVLLISKIYEK